MNHPNIEEVVDLIADPILGPYEGEDFHVNPDGTIQVCDNNVRSAALIMRKVNTSGLFDTNLVRVGHRGDTIILGFDTLIDSSAVYSSQIGPKNSTLAEVKASIDGKFFVYLDKKRSVKEFKKLSQAKTYITRTDKALKSQMNMVNGAEWVDEDDQVEDLA